MVGALSIAVLEDNLDRRQAMLARLTDRFPQFPVSFFHEPAEMIAHLRKHLPQTVLISLDLDLDLIPRPDGTLLDPGTGVDLVNYLLTEKTVCPVIVHSSNLEAARKMKRLLKSGGWPVIRVTPCDDLSWIDEEWFTKSRSLLLEQAVPSAPARTLTIELSSVP